MTATYNEAENIGSLIKDIFSLRKDCHILVVDDNSPDGTGSIVNKMMESDSRLHIIERPGKMGYGTAYIEGFLWALKRKNYEYIISMDSDYSHHPSYIEDMLHKIKTCDVVIGSRYIRGGDTVNWGLHRKVLSRSANIYSKMVLNIPVNDCTSGFRCYRREIVERIDFSKIKSNGYSFLEEILYCCKLLNASFGEVPIIFKDREMGKSKINKNEIFKAILMVPYLRITGRR
jgi:dolichol-phosphate mannosyltransferase